MKSEIQTWFGKMHEGSCLALDYIFSTLKGRTTSEFEASCYCVAALMSACEAGIVDENNGYVKDAVKLLELADPENKYTVEKKDIKSITEIPFETAAVRFDYNGRSHWVLCDQGTIVFDSLNDSQCRKNGKITTCRIIKKIDKKENK